MVDAVWAVDHRLLAVAHAMTELGAPEATDDGPVAITTTATAATTAAPAPPSASGAVGTWWCRQEVGSEGVGRLVSGLGVNLGLDQ